MTNCTISQKTRNQKKIPKQKNSKIVHFNQIFKQKSKQSKFNCQEIQMLIVFSWQQKFTPKKVPNGYAQIVSRLRHAKLKKDYKENQIPISPPSSGHDSNITQIIKKLIEFYSSYSRKFKAQVEKAGPKDIPPPMVFVDVNLGADKYVNN